MELRHGTSCVRGNERSFEWIGIDSLLGLGNGNGATPARQCHSATAERARRNTLQATGRALGGGGVGAPTGLHVMVNTATNGVGWVTSCPSEAVKSNVKNGRFGTTIVETAAEVAAMEWHEVKIATNILFRTSVRKPYLRGACDPDIGDTLLDYGWLKVCSESLYLVQYIQNAADETLSHQAAGLTSWHTMRSAGRCFPLGVGARHVVDEDAHPQAPPRCPHLVVRSYNPRAPLLVVFMHGRRAEGEGKHYEGRTGRRDFTEVMAWALSVKGG
ncbi:hypothetical protein BJV74DRAFT_797959 [Russula compacta]|nr:hypothetical protein BJV74DRAFT_797959 [Russula compacta]